MPARVWHHGIHAFLMVLRLKLPESLEHMIAFIDLAFSMLTLLYETVPAFEINWIECLGDLARFRMSIEECEPNDREVWSGIARFWYRKAANKSPTVGRFYHHLAVMARLDTLEQLSYCTRSLTCGIPFESARESTMTLLKPTLNGRDPTYLRPSTAEAVFIKAHGLLLNFPKWPMEDFEAALGQLKDGFLDEYIDKSGAKFKRYGVFAAMSNIAALLEYGALTESGKPRSKLRRTFEVLAGKLEQSTLVSDPSTVGGPSMNRSSAEEKSPLVMDDLSETETQDSQVIMSYASDLAFSTFKIALAESNWE